jgi:2-hydroxy-6-oxonona-2,4-dienedioate hydrolase
MRKAHRSIWTELLATPFRQGWVDAGGIKTRFVQAGNESKPPLIMLHGTAGSLENFAANIAAHAEHFNCIAFDMIGSGMTAKPDYDYETEHYVKHVADFFKAMDIKKASIIGLSLGARVASRFAIDHPENVERLILLSATAYFPARPIQSDIKSSRAAAAANPTWDSIREIFKGLFHDEKEIWDDLIATRLSLYSRPDMKQAMSHIRRCSTPRSTTETESQMKLGEPCARPRSWLRQSTTAMYFSIPRGRSPN